MTNILNKEEIATIKTCGKILRNALDQIASAIKPGISAFELDQIAEKTLTSSGAIPSFKNYKVQGIGRYPSALCVSINSEVVHGLPRKNKIVKDGDIVSLDLGAIYKGICTDAAVTVPVGNVSPKTLELVEATKESLYLGIKEAREGAQIGDIGHAVQRYLELNGFSVVRDLVGHGIGTLPHMEPQIPNYGNAGTGPEILEGMALAIEPMATAGDYKVTTADDRWTILTSDGSMAAHFEETIVIIDGEPVIVTR